MEKKTWEKPEMEVVEIEVEDRVIDTSGGGFTSSTTNATACN